MAVLEVQHLKKIYTTRFGDVYKRQALGSAFGAQLYYHMKKTMDFEGLLADGGIDAIREYLKENIHQYGKLKTSRQILKDVTGEDFNPEYYVRYLKEKYTRIYGLK